MSEADDVADIPGSGPFMELWRQAKGDSGAVGKLCAEWTSRSKTAAASTSAVRRSVSQVRSSWTGAASDAFGGYMSRYDAAAEQLGQRMHTASAAVESAANAVDQAIKGMNEVAGNIVTEYEALPREAKAAGGPRIVAKYLDAAQAHVSTLEKALDDSASRVGSADHTLPFTHLRPPGKASYLPSGHGPIQWSPTRPGRTGGVQTSSTDYSGGSGSGGSGSDAHTGGGGSGGGGSSGGPPSTPVTGEVKDWIEQARKILIDEGIPADKLSADDIAMIVQHESGGNPHAINNWDSNAAAGHPSKGLMQTIDSTFNSYALSGHKDIWNPVDNIIAGVRYAISRYGSLDNVPGVSAVHSGGSYVGY